MTEHALQTPAEIRRPGNPFARLTRAIRARPLVWFFALTYAFSWWPALLYASTGSGPAILGCGPFLAAVTVLAVTGGRSGVKALFRSMVKWRIGARWWALALLGPAVLAALATGLNIALGAPAPTSEELGTWTNIAPTALAILLIPVIGGAWEEPGWRGFALPRLLSNRSPLVASLVLGALWSIWHLPVYFVDDQHWSDLVLVVLATIAFTWFFQNALQSVLLAMVLHAVNNAVSGEYFSQMFEGADSTRQSWMLVVVWGAASALVIRFGRGFRKTPARA
jgi:uncharacterized protein